MVILFYHDGRGRGLCVHPAHARPPPAPLTPRPMRSWCADRSRQGQLCDRDRGAPACQRRLVDRDPRFVLGPRKTTAHAAPFPDLSPSPSLLPSYTADMPNVEEQDLRDFGGAATLLRHHIGPSGKFVLLYSNTSSLKVRGRLLNSNGAEQGGVGLHESGKGVRTQAWARSLRSFARLRGHFLTHDDVSCACVFRVLRPALCVTGLPPALPRCYRPPVDRRRQRPPRPRAPGNVRGVAPHPTPYPLVSPLLLLGPRPLTKGSAPPTPASSPPTHPPALDRVGPRWTALDRVGPR